MDYLLFGKSYFQPALTVPFADDGGGGEEGGMAALPFGRPSGDSLPSPSPPSLPSFPAIFSKFYEFPSFHQFSGFGFPTDFPQKNF
jgi:hypothetical protein